VSDRRTLLRAYRALRRAHGPRGWWPGRTRLEIILGAILTQNTAWSNVERALAAMRGAGLLRLPALRAVKEESLGKVIRSSGTFRLKARRVRAFLGLLDREFGGSLGRMSGTETALLRDRLLTVSGIGPETADSILLYAFGRPIFVVDAYTTRILARHGLAGERTRYDEIQRFFMDRLPADPELFNDYHAQLVKVGQEYCRRRPDCERCPLARILPPAQIPPPGRIPPPARIPSTGRILPPGRALPSAPIPPPKRIPPSAETSRGAAGRARGGNSRAAGGRLLVP